MAMAAVHFLFNAFLTPVVLNICVENLCCKLCLKQDCAKRGGCNMPLPGNLSSGGICIGSLEVVTCMQITQVCVIHIYIFVIQIVLYIFIYVFE